MAAYVELYMDQGATFNNTINITDDVTNAVVDLSNYTVVSRMKRSYYSANVTANLNCTVLNPISGEVILSLPAANTANIRPGRYLFDVKTIDQSNTTNRILEGIITVTPGIS